MAKVKLLIDTDIFIDYFNTGFLAGILENKRFQIHYSVVTKKELLAKANLKDSERKVILGTLKQYRIIPLDVRIASMYSHVRRRHSALKKEDALIAATALVWNLPLVTRNWKHYNNIVGLTLFKGIH